jgi:hypothetical protein
MATLQEHNENVFREEHQRLFRALMESIEREEQHIRRFRQLKEDLVSVALRLQVANQMSALDNYTVGILRNEVTEARRDALIATKQFGEATDAILGLKREIQSLKRKMKEIVTPGEQPDAVQNENFSLPKGADGGTAGSAMGFGGASSFGEVADSDVDKMMSQKIKIPLPNGISTSSKTTTFQEWKMQQFLYAPDTPAASMNHDKAVVDLMFDAASKAQGDRLDERFTKSITAKKRPLDMPNNASVNYKEGSEEEIARSLAGIILPSMNRKSPGKQNLWASHVAASQLSPPPKGTRIETMIKKHKQEKSKKVQV